jgi:hypothetical protein
MLTPSFELEKLHKQTVLSMLGRNSSLKHSLESKCSKIDSAGDGLFLRGFARKNSVVVLYPGRFYPSIPPQLSAVGDAPIKLPVSSELGDHVFIMNCRTLGGFLDGKYGSSNNFGQGHMINHPPSGFLPNVAPVEFFWRDILHLQPEHLWNDVEIINFTDKGVWYIDPTSYEIIYTTKNMHNLLVGCAFITLRDIQDGEELYFNYEYPPKVAECLSWYT